MAITILAIGKKHDSWVQEGIERYQKRLRAPFNVEWILLPHSSLESSRARLEESERIISRLTMDYYVVLLDERGKELSSPALVEHLESCFTAAKQVVFVIGGAYGVTDALRQRANIVVSLSQMVFPHQLVRLILVEQLYRAQQIAAGGSYHHE